ncbi:MAG: ElyC/SanA/YdcF family protein [Bacteroidota bacterium]
MAMTLVALMLLGALVIWGCNYWVEQSTAAQIYSDLDQLPSNKVALVLGTNRLIRNRYRNPYFDTRMDAAYQLYATGKVKHLILSGDNGRKSYSEPDDMKAALMERGVPESAITLDYAGFRTLDSVVRCNAVFQQSKFTIISQKFHNHRALFIASQKGLDAIAYNAETPWANVTNKVKIREYLARCKAVLDLYVLGKGPRFYGDKIRIDV